MSDQPCWKGLLSEFQNIDPKLVQELLTKFCRYLIEVNAHINLVSRTDTKNLTDRLVFDSLAMLRHIDYSQGALLLDIGSGAGFPWIVHKIIHSDIQIISVDSNRRKIEFQRNAARLLEFVDCRFISERIEQQEPLGADFAIAKAVGSIEVVGGLARPHLKQGGKLILPRGDGGSPVKSIPGFAVLEATKYQSAPAGRLSSLVILQKT